MICQDCAGDGKRSRIDISGAVKHDGPVERFCDEDGAPHTHDHSFGTEEMKCTNGHEWIHVQPHRCWCGWFSGKEETP